MLGISCLRISFLVAVETRYEGNLYVFALMFPFRDLWHIFLPETENLY